MPHAKGCYSLPYPEGRSGACSCKLDKPTFAGERQSDRAARTVLHLAPVKCSETCPYGKHSSAWEHSVDCPRYVKPSDDLPF